MPPIRNRCRDDNREQATKRVRMTQANSAWSRSVQTAAAIAILEWRPRHEQVMQCLSLLNQTPVVSKKDNLCFCR